MQIYYNTRILQCKYTTIQGCYNVRILQWKYTTIQENYNAIILKYKDFTIQGYYNGRILPCKDTTIQGNYNTKKLRAHHIFIFPCFHISKTREQGSPYFHPISFNNLYDSIVQGLRDTLNLVRGEILKTYRVFKKNYSWKFSKLCPSPQGVYSKENPDCFCSVCGVGFAGLIPALNLNQKVRTAMMSCLTSFFPQNFMKLWIWIIKSEQPSWLVRLHFFP